MNTLHVPCEIGEISDGYHTFNELYEHRCLLFMALMKSHPDISWVSLIHDDGTSIEGWFIAGMHLPSGDITYHLPIKYWYPLIEIVQCKARAPKWDGHNSRGVIVRLMSWIGSK